MAHLSAPLDSQKPFLYAFHTVRGIGSEALARIWAHFYDFKIAWETPTAKWPPDLLSPTVKAAIAEKQSIIDVAQLYNKDVKTPDITIITCYEDTYPERLRDLTSPPFLIYARGDISLLAEPSIAIVGTRKITTYGIQATTRLSHDVAAAGIHIISGFALGVDAAAHQSFLQTEVAGKAIAVLGGGVDDASITPRSHVSLAHTILARGGVIISEYTPNTSPSRGTFPARNHLMAAMSHGVLVIEGTRDSGTMITAGVAQELARPLFAVPGSIFSPQSVGPHDLISEHKATITLSAETILTTLNASTESGKKEHTKEHNLTGINHAIYDALSNTPEGLAIDQLIAILSFSESEISTALVMLEIDGMIKKTQGGIFIII